jgi:protein mago nashi
MLRSLISRREDDSKWPEKNRDGRQELEIRLGNEHISFEVSMLSNVSYASVAD